MVRGEGQLVSVSSFLAGPSSVPGRTTDPAYSPYAEEGKQMQHKGVWEWGWHPPPRSQRPPLWSQHPLTVVPGVCSWASVPLGDGRSCWEPSTALPSGPHLPLAHLSQVMGLSAQLPRAGRQQSALALGPGWLIPSSPLSPASWSLLAYCLLMP